MLTRILFVGFALFTVARSSVNAAEHDYLRRGEEKLTANYEIVYDRAVRYVLARGWRKDVVVRMVDIPPFQDENVTGVARTASGYKAFYVTASKHIWTELGLGMAEAERKKMDYRTIRPVLHERPISDELSARIAMLWRLVLFNPRNYGKDPSFYLDTDHFSYYVSFLSNERLTAYVVGWGPQTEQLINVSAAIATYANGLAPDHELVGAIEKAERKLITSFR